TLSIRYFSLVLFLCSETVTSDIYTLSLHDALPIFPTTLPTAYDVYPLDGRHDGGYYTVKDCVTIDVLPRTPGNNVYSHTVLDGIDRKSGSAGMPRPISYAVFCLKKKTYARTVNC